MNDRIRLAEAMNVPEWEAYCHPSKNPGNVTLPDPFTDANDDYAVLEWMRSWKYKDHPKRKWTNRFCAARDFLKGGGRELSLSYQIGDYARAALKVLDNE